MKNECGKDSQKQAVTRCTRTKIQHLRKEKIAVRVLHGRSGFAHVSGDEIDLESLNRKGNLRLSLVDHHVLQPSDTGLVSSVVNVLDHRPQDPAWSWDNTDITLRIVGSCCTLVAEKLFTVAPDLVTPIVAVLLLGTILLDTACLSPAVGRATPQDHQMAEALQARCDSPVERYQLFRELQAAKSDISSLTSSHLLIKDLKVAAGIPIAGLPIKVKIIYIIDPEENWLVLYTLETVIKKKNYFVLFELFNTFAVGGNSGYHCYAALGAGGILSEARVPPHSHNHAYPADLLSVCYKLSTWCRNSI
ncbi:hypothetical protein J6590_051176 [Homalodisca vitripennis]|nr:hypothetical protein J6590_051176 [Homalodisca vitripennis]